MSKRTILALSAFCLALFCLHFQGFAQEKNKKDQTKQDALTSDLPDRGLQFKEYQQLWLPSLNALIQTALENSPLIRQQEAMVDMRDWQTKSAKLDWTRYFQLFSEARYGAVDYVVVGGIGTGQITDNTFRYNIGTRIQLNAFDFLDQKKKEKTAEAVLDFEKAKVEEAKRLIIDEVIKQYNQVITYKEIIRIKSDNLQGQLTNMEKMELKFATGDEDLMEFARIKEITTKAQEEFELAKKEFREAYMLLENLVGVKLDQIAGKN
ncbi:MAG TPA: hypothetical protein DC042_04745 [Bacteroidales bacterium]|nr:hypothetical protein [Bacteroidales bacterium]